MKLPQSMIAAAVLLFAIDLHAQTTTVDPKAHDLAEATLERMGGADRWEDTRYLVWSNFGEMHYWDKETGMFRWEEDSLTSILDLNSREGHFWIDGIEVTDPDDLKQRLDRVYARWVNNSYWFIMPYKMLDPGVNLRYMGEDTTRDGRMADVVQMTFENVGLTPMNKYMVYIDQQTKLVCQWSYYRHRDDPEPQFTRPWTDWREYDGIMLSGGRGDEGVNITKIAVPESLPRAMFRRLTY